MFYSSLYCLKGQDSPTRFIAIQISALLGMLIFHAIFIGSAMATIVALLFATLAGLSALRRVRDGAANGSFALVLWLGASLSGLFITQSHWLALLPVMFIWLGFSLQLLRLKAVGKFDYQMGYCGPKYRRPRNRIRLEPELNDMGQPLKRPVAQQQNMNAEAALNPVTFTLPNLLARQPRKRLMVFGAAIIALIGVSVVAYNMATNPSQSEPLTVQEASEMVVPEKVVESLAFDDGFSLHLASDSAGLSLSWLGEHQRIQTLWSLVTAKGDKSCLALQFKGGKNSTIRPLWVEVDEAGRTIAQFSPVDNSLIVKEVAKGSSMKLCGYDFSLRGSSNTLKSNSNFNRLLK